MFLNKTIIFSALAGVVVGAIGYKIYNENQDVIKSKLKDAGMVPPNEAANDENANGDEITLEELMSQKEHLEDLIAEYQAKHQGQ